jgi:hypothetical protein
MDGCNESVKRELNIRGIPPTCLAFRIHADIKSIDKRWSHRML